MASALERAARAAWDEIARQNGENTGGYAGTYAGRSNYVEGFIDTSALARAVLLAVRGSVPESAREAGFDVAPCKSDLWPADPEDVFAAMIDAILNEKDTTND